MEEKSEGIVEPSVGIVEGVVPSKVIEHEDDEAMARRLQAEENRAYPAADPQHAVYRAEAVNPPPRQPGPSGGGGRFGDVAEYHDIAFAVLFAVVFAGFIAVIVLLLRHGVHLGKLTTHDAMGWLLFLVGGSAIATAATVGWLLLIRRYPKECIMASLVAQISFCLVLTVLCFFFGALLYGLLFMLLTLILGFYLWAVRDNIPFAACILTIVGSVMKCYPQCYYLALASLIPQLLFILLFIAALLVVCDNMDHKIETDSVTKLAIFFLAFGLFWTSQVMRNVVHMSVAGVAASWYFLVGPDGVGPPNPLSRSLKRACTNSFGSICFGSLLVAFIQTLRFMVRSQSDGFCAICADCLLSCIESALAFMNKFAFTYIAIYGGNFCDGGSSVWNLIKERGFDLIINDDLTETVFFTIALFNGITVAVIVGLLAWACHVKYALLLAIIAFVVAYLLSAFALSVLDSGVATLFVCFAEDPEQLEATRPDLHAQLRNAWVVRYGEEDWEVRMYTGAPPPHM